MAKERGKDWLPEGRATTPRRNVLEDTLFRRLEDLRKKPTGELSELVERTLEVLRATKDALLEQRRELRALTSTVETLRQRVDILSQARKPDPPIEPVLESTPESEPVTETEPVLESEPVWEPERRWEPEESRATEETPEDHIPEVIFEPEALHVEVAHVEVAPVEVTPADPAPEPEPAPEEHLVLLATPAGYRLQVEAGPPPAPGSRLLYDGVVYRAERSAPSPFPSDPRRACLALPATITAADDQPDES